MELAPDSWPRYRRADATKNSCAQQLPIRPFCPTIPYLKENTAEEAGTMSQPGIKKESESMTGRTPDVQENPACQ
jgi:hypothetical protein